MNLFDELRKNGEIEEDICINGEKHKYVELDSYIKDGKKYSPLICTKCKYVSLGWVYV